MYRYDDDDNIYCSTDHEDIVPSVLDGCDIVENAMLSKGEKQEKQKEEGEKHDVDSEDEDGDSADDEDPEVTKRYWEMKVAEDIHKASVCLTLGNLLCDAFPSQERKVMPLMT